MELSIIIVNYNERDYTARVVDALAPEFLGVKHEIIVVDNASSDASADFFRHHHAEVRLVETEQNLMYGKGNNAGLNVATGQWLLLINPDVEWTSGQLRTLYTAAQATTNTMVAPAVWSANGRRQLTAHRRFPVALDGVR